MSMIQATADIAKKAKITKIGVEANTMSVELLDRLADKLPKIEWARTSNLVEELRMIKDREEIELTRTACWQAHRAFEVVRASLTPDQSEREVAALLENELRRFGAKGCSFPPIIAVGPRAALPHATPTEKKIGEDDFVLIDWGSHEGLYMSDLTRILVTGKISPKLRKIYNIVLKAQLAGIKAIGPGVKCGDVDKAARRVIEKAGFGPQFGHGLGHGVGLEIHESPRLGTGQTTELQPGMIVTVEPGIYLPGWGGVRIEDDVLVTRDGCEVLTSVPKQLDECIVG
jgi:Xaa-Pro aminopeptidase